MTAPSLSVEFFGMPATGKSTLSRLVAEHLEKRGLPVFQPSYDLAHGGGSGRRLLLKVGAVARGCILHPIDSGREVARLESWTHCSPRVLFNWLLVTALLRRSRNKTGIHLFDQGVLQGLWSIGFEADRDGTLKFLQHPRSQVAGWPSLVIDVHASLEQLEARIRARPANRSRVDRELDRTPSILQEGQVWLERLRGAVLDQFSGTVLTITNDVEEERESQALRIADAVEACWGDAHGARR